MFALGNIATLCAKELAVLARDRQAAALLFGMPAIFVFLLSLALEDVHGEKVGTKLKVVLEVEDDGPNARRIEDSLRAPGNFALVRRPEGMENDELFRSGAARAVVRIPAGFSGSAEALLSNTSDAEVGANPIEWEASPGLDASYRWLIEARLALICMEMVQEGLVREQTELGEELVHLAAKLEETGEQLESTVALLGASPEELEEVAARAAAEAAANERARTAREALIARGAPADGAPPGGAFPGDLSVGIPQSRVSVPVRVESLSVAAYETPLDVQSAAPLVDVEPTTETEVSSELERLAARLEAPPVRKPDADVFLREAAGERETLPTPLQQTVPGWSLFAMFFVVVPLSNGLHRERIEGTLRRILALGVPKSAIVTGKLLPYVLIGVIQFGVMLGVGMYLVPQLSGLSLELGEHPSVLLPITVACALAASSYGLLVASLARTPEQAAAFGATSVIILSLLGGVMVPHFIMPSVMQQMAFASPIYWGHRAYLDAFLHGASLADVANSLYVLVGFTLLCLAIAARRVAR